MADNDLQNPNVEAAIKSRFYRTSSPSESGPRVSGVETVKRGVSMPSRNLTPLEQITNPQPVHDQVPPEIIEHRKSEEFNNEIGIRPEQTRKLPPAVDPRGVEGTASSKVLISPEKVREQKQEEQKVDMSQLSCESLLDLNSKALTEYKERVDKDVKLEKKLIDLSKVQIENTDTRRDEYFNASEMSGIWKPFFKRSAQIIGHIPTHIPWKFWKKDEWKETFNSSPSGIFEAEKKAAQLELKAREERLNGKPGEDSGLLARQREADSALAKQQQFQNELARIKELEKTDKTAAGAARAVLAKQVQESITAHTVEKDANGKAKSFAVVHTAESKQINDSISGRWQQAADGATKMGNVVKAVKWLGMGIPAALVAAPAGAGALTIAGTAALAGLILYGGYCLANVGNNLIQGSSGLKSWDKAKSDMKDQAKRDAIDAGAQTAAGLILRPVAWACRSLFGSIARLLPETGNAAARTVSVAGNAAANTATAGAPAAAAQVAQVGLFRKTLGWTLWGISAPFRALSWIEDKVVTAVGTIPVWIVRKCFGRISDVPGNLVEKLTLKSGLPEYTTSVAVKLADRVGAAASGATYMGISSEFNGKLDQGLAIDRLNADPTFQNLSPEAKEKRLQYELITQGLTDQQLKTDFWNKVKYGAFGGAFINPVRWTAGSEGYVRKAVGEVGALSSVVGYGEILEDVKDREESKLYSELTGTNRQFRHNHFNSIRDNFLNLIIPRALSAGMIRAEMRANMPSKNQQNAQPNSGPVAVDPNANVGAHATNNAAGTGAGIGLGAVAALAAGAGRANAVLPTASGQPAAAPGTTAAAATNSRPQANAGNAAPQNGANPAAANNNAAGHGANAPQPQANAGNVGPNNGANPAAVNNNAGGQHGNAPVANNGGPANAAGPNPPVVPPPAAVNQRPAVNVGPLWQTYSANIRNQNLMVRVRAYVNGRLVAAKRFDHFTDSKIRECVKNGQGDQIPQKIEDGVGKTIDGVLDAAIGSATEIASRRGQVSSIAIEIGEFPRSIWGKLRHGFKARTMPPIDVLDAYAAQDGPNAGASLMTDISGAGFIRPKAQKWNLVNLLTGLYRIGKYGPQNVDFAVSKQEKKAVTDAKKPIIDAAREQVKKAFITGHP